MFHPHWGICSHRGPLPILNEEVTGAVLSPGLTGFWRRGGSEQGSEVADLNLILLKSCPAPTPLLGPHSCPGAFSLLPFCWSTIIFFPAVPSSPTWGDGLEATSSAPEASAGSLAGCMGPFCPRSLILGGLSVSSHGPMKREWHICLCV